MKRSCPYCGGIHDQGAICPRKPKPKQTDDRHRSQAGDLRKRNIWKRTSVEIRKRDSYLCRACLDKGILNTKNLSVHHITPINEDPKRWLDSKNLITLCNVCHDEAEEGLIDRDYLRQLAGTVAKIPRRGKVAKK